MKLRHYVIYLNMLIFLSLILVTENSSCSSIFFFAYFRYKVSIVLIDNIGIIQYFLLNVQFTYEIGFC